MAESWQREWGARAATAEVAGGRRGRTLLLVHGDTDGVDGRAGELEQRLDDLSVVTSERAADALDRLADDGVDCVVSDAELPDGDGLELLDDEGRHGFFVADDGDGFDPEMDLFERGVTSNPEGTGFGLSIVQGIAEAHGWEVAATDSESGGARFEVTGVEFA